MPSERRQVPSRARLGSVAPRCTELGKGKESAGGGGRGCRCLERDAGCPAERNIRAQQRRRHGARGAAAAQGGQRPAPPSASRPVGPLHHGGGPHSALPSAESGHALPR
ncbi:hypothetical protein MTO96_008519 [Rhipicephalus appendiculatus]